jgi:hypothetical protein
MSNVDIVQATLFRSETAKVKASGISYLNGKPNSGLYPVRPVDMPLSTARLIKRQYWQEVSSGKTTR